MAEEAAVQSKKSKKPKRTLSDMTIKPLKKSQKFAGLDLESIFSGLLAIEADERKSKRKKTLKKRTAESSEELPPSPEPSSPKEIAKGVWKESVVEHTETQEEGKDPAVKPKKRKKVAEQPEELKPEVPQEATDLPLAATPEQGTEKAKLMKYLDAMKWDDEVKEQVINLASTPAAKPIVRVAYRRRGPQRVALPTESKPAAPSLAAKNKSCGVPKEYAAKKTTEEEPKRPKQRKSKVLVKKRRQLREILVLKCPPDILEAELVDYYSALGPDCVEEVKFAWSNHGPFGTPHFLGFGIVKFHTVKLAEQASQMPPPTIRGNVLGVRYGALDRLMAKNAYVKIPKGPDQWRRLLAAWEAVMPKPEWTVERMEREPIHKNLLAHLRRRMHDASDTHKHMGKTVAEFEGGVQPPIFSFNEVDFGEAVNAKLREDFTAPMPIQGHAWPILLAGRDCVGLAETGSGKTLAFLLPARTHLQHYLQLRHATGSAPTPRVLTLVPTRELAQQIAEEFEKWKLDLDYITGIACGGSSAEVLSAALQCDVLISSPAQLLQAVYRRHADLSKVTFLVIDEADHMLHMGSAVHVASVCTQIRPDRQTCMFSATWLKDVRSLARQVLSHPLKVVINKVSTGLANPNIAQKVIILEDWWQKEAELQKLFAEMRSPEASITRTIIFVSHRRNVDHVMKLMGKMKVDALPFTASLPPEERQKNLTAFRQDPHGVLVCTDVAAHGLDIKDVHLVVNYDLPFEISQYVHRIGRTGRAGQSGTAYSFYYPNDDWKIVRQLIRCIRESGQEVPLQLYEFAKNAYWMKAQAQTAGEGSKKITWYSQ